jgi:hypothetical protein
MLHTNPAVSNNISLSIDKTDMMQEKTDLTSYSFGAKVHPTIGSANLQAGWVAEGGVSRGCESCNGQQGGGGPYTREEFRKGGRAMRLLRRPTKREAPRNDRLLNVLVLEWAGR